MSHNNSSTNGNSPANSSRIANNHVNSPVKTIIVAAPSGAGKSSFVNRLCSENPRIVDVVTYTTRSKRVGEVDGVAYHFVSSEEFKRKNEEGFFVEWAMVHSNMYGTPWDQIKTAWKKGQVVIMDIDVQGAQTFREKLPEGLRTVFILPPSIEELRRRITSRDGAMAKDLELRLKNAEQEMAHAFEFDIKIINDDFERSYLEFKKTIEFWMELG